MDGAEGILTWSERRWQIFRIEAIVHLRESKMDLLISDRAGVGKVAADQRRQGISGYAEPPAP